MSVIRVIKREKNYFTIQKEALLNPKLSFKAKGLWAYCMSRKDDWSFHVRHLATISKEKRDAIYTMIDELIKYGYCIKMQQQKHGNGRFSKIEYVICETIEEMEDFKKSLPRTGFPDTVDLDPENPPLVINEREQIDKHKDIPLPPKKGNRPSSKRVEKKEVARFVKVTKVQEEELLKRAQGSPDLVQSWYDFLSTWKVGKGIEDRGNDYGSILRWVIKAVSEEQAKPKPEDRKKENRLFALKVKTKFHFHPDIRNERNHMDFSRGMYSKIISYEENGFKDQVLNEIRKMNLPTDGLI